jgi:hypothetical protein
MTNCIAQVTNSFLVSTIIATNIFHKKTILANTPTDVYVADFLGFHFLLIEHPKKDKTNEYWAQMLILPKKFTDKFKDKIWDKIIDEFFKIVQGVDNPIREGKPIGITVGPVETRQKDGSWKADLNSTSRQSHITAVVPPIDCDKYKKFIEKYY